jgi:iron complex transport system ATP-binding protein
VTTPPPPARLPALAVEDLVVRYGELTALDVAALEIRRGEVTAVIGPNGCGKSTLLRTLGRLVRPDRGRVLLDGTPLRDLSSRAVARELAILPQGPVAPDGLTVADLVSRGRDPHRRWYDQWSRDDERVVGECLEATGMADLADRGLDALSGGQRQRAWIAMALAQDTGILLLDEPTTYLDVVHQLDVLGLVRDLNARRGLTVVMVLHDLTMAARYADRLVAMRDGSVLADGTAADVITPDVLRRVFDLECEVVHDRLTGRPAVVPLARAAAEATSDPGRLAR